MEAIKKQFILPVEPQVAAKLPVVYPWENTEIYNLCVRLYQFAVQSGYTQSLDEFKAHFGAYLEEHPSIIEDSYYDGQYEVTPLPLVQQILKTKNTILTQNIVIEPIPFAQTSNLAGGYTVTIG